MAVERDWRQVTFTVQSGRVYSLGDPTMTLSPTLLDQEFELIDGEILIGIRTGFGGLPVLEKGTPGILRGSKVLDDGQLEVTTDNVRVVISEPDKLILIAESCDGTTNPSSFAVL